MLGKGNISCQPMVKQKLSVESKIKSGLWRRIVFWGKRLDFLQIEKIVICGTWARN